MSLRQQSGQGLIEYIILVALVAVAAIGFVRTFQNNLNKQIANIANAVSGKPSRIQHGDTISADDFKKKDFGNFMNGVSTHEQQ
jgi:Flp pilus assembly pilin Flp